MKQRVTTFETFITISRDALFRGNNAASDTTVYLNINIIFEYIVINE